MKKLWAILLCVVLVLTVTACSGENSQVTETTEKVETPNPAAPVIITEEVKAELDAVLEKREFEGIVQLTHNGEVIYQSVSGTNDMGQPLTIDSQMYIGSISKQFCAAAILMLRDQGKLSLDDTLEKYFPEYTIGKDITLKNLLTMRSGICRDVNPMLNEPEKYEQNTVEENEALFKEYVFSQPLIFAPDTAFGYSNNNYRLLAFVVEQVSGQRYEDFIRQNIYEPLGMTHSGFKIEVKDHPEWGLTYDKIQATGQVSVLAKGAGGVVTTAADMDIWMTALQSGKVVCEESYQEMITDYSPEMGAGMGYGYGLMMTLRDGRGHNGGNGGYTSQMYFNEAYGYNLFMVTNTATMYVNPVEKVSTDFLRILFTATDDATGN